MSFFARFRQGVAVEPDALLLWVALEPFEEVELINVFSWAA